MGHTFYFRVMKALAFLVPDPELYPREPPLPSEMVMFNSALGELHGGGGVGVRGRVMVKDGGQA